MPADQPIFVLCCARSGWTLLRYALDAHPMVSCPAEMHLGGLMNYLIQVYSLTGVEAGRPR